MTKGIIVTTGNTEASNTEQRDLPAYSDLAKPSRKDVRPVIRDLIKTPTVWTLLKPYIFNGVVTGHKVMDLAKVVGILRENDTANRLGPFELNDYQIGRQFNAALREVYTMDKSWKVTAVKSLAAPTTQPATPAEPTAPTEPATAPTA